MKQMIPAKLCRKPDNGNKFKPLNEASLKCIGCETASTILSRYYKGVVGGLRQSCDRVICIGNTSSDQDSQCNKVYSPYGIMTTLTAGTHGYANGYVAEI